MVAPHRFTDRATLLVVAVAACCVVVVGAFKGCDVQRIQQELVVTNGTFTSANYGHGNYEPNLQCIYTFIAKPGYRVRVAFHSFALTGTPNRCSMDYIDIYSELTNPNVDLVRFNMSGRFCGTVAPKTRISLRNVIVIVFHTRATTTGAPGFEGEYEFLPEERYVIGTPMSGQTCGYTISATYDRSGIIISPTYPGAYPRNFHCSYWLTGQRGQRIKIYLNDFDLYFGGEHCPYDSLTVYDGTSNKAPIIKKICGMQQALSLYSKGSDMFLEFNTTNPSMAEHRGFQLDYQFNSNWVDVDALIGGESGIMHMRGTECDIRVKSNVETQHWIKSPNYPGVYPPHTTCIYIIDGLQGVENLEKVNLSFEKFNIPAVETSNCTDASLWFYLTEQDWLNPEETPDARVCDVNERELGDIQAAGARMVLKFHTTSLIIGGYGFRAHVVFKTDFGIPGIAMDDQSKKCAFRFGKTDGYTSIQSPRYPENYPLATNCTYYLVGDTGDRVRLYFEQFQLSRGRSPAERCDDHLYIYEVMDEHTDAGLKFSAKYCPDQEPGPFISSMNYHIMKVLFVSNRKYANTGFKATFDFKRQPKTDIPGENPDLPGCGGYIEDAPAGYVQTPKAHYEPNWVCTWEIRVKQGYRVMLKHDKQIEVEGTMSHNTSQCAPTVIRVWGAGPDKPFTHELCGIKSHLLPVIYSDENVLRFSFITSPKSTSLPGFNFTWTRVRSTPDPSDQCRKDELHCDGSLPHFCIDRSLRCNDVPNCGENDRTDEVGCIQIDESMAGLGVTLSLIAIGCVLFLVILIVSCVLLKRQMKQKFEKAKQTKRSQRRAAKAASPSQGSARIDMSEMHHRQTPKLINA